MTDYLIDQYNAKIEAALEAKQNALAAATQIWHKAVDEIIGRWQAATTEAAIEMMSAREHRDSSVVKMYVEGPPPTSEAAPPQIRPTEETVKAVTAQHFAGMASEIEAEPPHDDHDD